MANINAPLSDVAIANMGGTMLEERALVTLDDGTNYARFVSREFGYLRDEMLKAFPWHFNRWMARLAPEVTPPAFRYKYSYAVPADCLRVYPMRRGSDQNGCKIEYEMFSGHIFTNEGPVLDVVYGRRMPDSSRLDPLFARALGCQLGAMASQRITGKEGYTAKATAMFKDAWQMAIHVSSLEMGSDHYVDGFGEETLLSVRGSFMQ